MVGNSSVLMHKLNCFPQMTCDAVRSRGALYFYSEPCGKNIDRLFINDIIKWKNYEVG